MATGCYLLGRVGLLEELLGDLAKVVDEADGSIALQGIFDAENIDVALVEKMMKYIYSLDRG